MMERVTVEDKNPFKAVRIGHEKSRRSGVDGRKI